MNETILAAIVGGLLTSIPTLVITIVTLREERKRRVTDGAIQCAVAEWQRALEFADKEATKGRSFTVAPMASYYIGSHLLIEATQGGGCDEEKKDRIRKAIFAHKEIYKAFSEAGASSSEKCSRREEV